MHGSTIRTAFLGCSLTVTVTTIITNAIAIIITTLKIITFIICVKVPSSITVLILHLALCDLLYCIIGMPNQMSIYTNSYLK